MKEEKEQSEEVTYGPITTGQNLMMPPVLDCTVCGCPQFIIDNKQACKVY